MRRGNILFNEKKEVKSAYEPSGPSGRSLSWFPKHEATRGIFTPPGWNACPSQGYPAGLNSPAPIHLPKSEEREVSC